MGAIAAEYADLVIVTSDNPRTEDPNAIIREILAGMEGHENAPARGRKPPQSDPRPCNRGKKMI